MLIASASAAEAPRHPDVWGFAFDATPASAGELLERQYPDCRPARSVYHASSSHAEEVTAALDINAGLIHNDPAVSDACPDSPGGAGATDGIELLFLHRELDLAQPLYHVDTRRVYPDTVYAGDKRIRKPFEALRAELFRKYGKPTDERREKVVSSAENLARSLAVRPAAKREDYVVRYLWSRAGRLPAEEHEGSTCDCGGPYVKAEIEISRSPVTIPKNRYYVLSVRLLLEDPVQRSRQDRWNAQWQNRDSQGKK